MTARSVESCGLLKMDFLGLSHALDHGAGPAARRTQQQRHRSISTRSTWPTSRSYELFVRGDTKGIFQFESGGMRDVLMKMKPNRIEDLIAANALYRPGPMVYIDSYVARKHGETLVHAPPAHDRGAQRDLRHHGLPGAGLAAREPAGRHRAEAGLPPGQGHQQEKDVDDRSRARAVHRRVAEERRETETANEIFEDILRFGGYAFNKAHSTGYALVAYKTA